MSIAGGFFSPVLDPQLRLVGFTIWFVGNLLWMNFSYKNRKWGMWAMQFMFSLQNGAGIVNMVLGAV